jgi:hypothetical protein
MLTQFIQMHQHTLGKKYWKLKLTWSDVMPFSKAVYKLSFVIAPTIRFGS